MKRNLLLKTMLLLCAIVFGTSAWATDVTDVITFSGLGVTNAKPSVSYLDFSGKTFTSNAVYAGQAADGSSSTQEGKYIQLRSSKPAGIVTTTSGGRIKSVRIEWNSATTNTSRTVDVYGKNTAYTGSDQLYESSSTNQGTKILSFTKSDGDQTLTVTGDYAYIGLRSNNGALYLDKITIVWEVNSTDPSATLSSTSLDFGEVEVGNTKELTFTVTPANLKGGLTIASNNDKYGVSPTSIAQDATGAQTITVTAAPTALDDDMDGTITISGGGLASDETVTLTATTYQVANVTLVGNNGSFEVNDETVTSLTSRVGSTATIKAVPAQGYYFTSWAADGATPASSTDAETEFTFTSATVTLTATFTAIPTHTVTWSVNGVETTNKVEEGAAVTFPANPADLGGKKFVGWTTSAIDGTTETAPTYVTSATMGNSDVTYYAVFATASGSGNGWVATDIASLTASDVFVIVGKNASGYYAMSNDKGTGAAPGAVEVTVDGGKITSTVAAKIKWNISGNATAGYIFYPNGSTTTWLYCIDQNNGVRVGDSENNTFVIANDYLYNSGQERYLGIYSSQDWRCYTSINANIREQSFAFYKYTATTYSDFCTTVTKTLNLNASGYATYSDAFDFEVTSGATAYTAILNTANNKITCSEIEGKKIKAGEGVLLYGDAGATVVLSYTAGATALEDNDLKGTTTSDGSLATMEGSKYYYALSGDTFMRYKPTPSAFVPNKAYFESDTELNSKAFAIVFDSETTAINGIEDVAPKTTKTRKVVKNGRLVIETANGEFTIDGARMK